MTAPGVRLKKGAAILLFGSAGTKQKSWLQQNLTVSGQHMEIRRSMLGLTAGPVPAGSIMPKAKCTASLTVSVAIPNQKTPTAMPPLK